MRRYGSLNDDFESPRPCRKAEAMKMWLTTHHRGVAMTGLGSSNPVRSAKAIGDAGINLSFVMAQVVGRRYSAMFGFENEADAARGASLIKKAAAPVRKR